MKRIAFTKTMALGTAGLLTGIGLAATGIASAATSSNITNTNRPGIARYTMQETRLNAVAAVLGTTPSQFADTLKTQTLKQIVQSKGWTMQQFHDKVKAEVQSELLAAGYSQTQIDATASHRHHHKK